MSEGALAGVRVVEFGTIGPGPFVAMMLADHGAEVVHVDRPGGVPAVGPIGDRAADALHRNRRSVEIDLKSPEGLTAALALIADADILIEGNRPGVAERLGIGPEDALALNPRLIYGRVTGWGQTGPKSALAGHDLNFVAASGTLSTLGRAGQPPTVPLAYVGDLGGGAMMLAFGVLAALHERHTSGRGQVVDAAIVDGAALLATAFHGFAQRGLWDENRRGVNLVDSGAPFYDCYETSDGEWMAVGALEPKFYAELLRVLGLDADALPGQHDRARWPELRAAIGAAIGSRPRAYWADAARGTDACLEPVLRMSEVRHDAHNAARQVMVEVDGIWQPAPAPRFSRTPAPPPEPGRR
ncbi:MAG: CaiB/BaiF CoA-transferase family protein [Propioniciclava sp.]|uniref:CaiB/BaiF CoA transferase family protein n=1 Tax=Propioniciclava sp. TaxID=2038686 RepID=UPI0039E4437F